MFEDECTQALENKGFLKNNALKTLDNVAFWNTNALKTLTTGGSATLQQVRNFTLPVRDVIDEMLYDVGFLWILEEACIENT